ncbi:MAG TPA: Gldg family protein [bacterium]|nr:Gldg family protein [bacterium]HMW35852.1 Gldg family protein [bacterium]HMZ02961.1 Gldg family protein [bacterium]HNB08229.1 Gldg family protein [bacterium]HNB55955.1 Gldg family protein [bacterium]
MLKITNKSTFINYVLLIAAIVVMANIVSRNLFVRWDATDNKQYSLSESSKEVIGKLKDPMQVKVYFSDNLPGPLANTRRYVQDLLEEYQAFSDGQFVFEFVNPDADDKAKEKAQQLGIGPVPVQAVENDKMEMRNVYMGMVLLYGDKKEPIPVIQSTEGLEYMITATMKKIAATNLKNVGIISPENEEISTQNLNRFLDQLYTVRSVSLGSDISADIQTIIMNGVSDSVKLDDLYRLDQFLMRGGKLFIGQSNVKDFFQQGFATDIRSNIFTFLEHYGVRIGKEMITDQSCSQIQMQSQQGFFMMRTAVDYPPFPMIRNFNTSHILTQKMTVARLFFVNEVSSAEAAGTTFTPLMFTSDKTGMLNGPFYQINPTQNPMMKAFPFGTKTVAALVEGTFTSFFKDSARYASRAGFIPANNNGQIIIVTDNQFFNDRRAGGVQENTDFILNAVDYLSGDKELIAIRSRDVSMRPLAEMTDSERRSWKWINILAPGALVILFGLYMWRRNRQQRKMLEDRYA